MNRWILNGLPWHVDLDDAMKRLCIPEDDADDFVSMFHTIVRKIHPVFYFGRETVESNDGHHVVIGLDVQQHEGGSGASGAVAPGVAQERR